MALLKSGIVLSEGEELVMELEAELWSQSSNPIAMFIGGFFKFIAMILGNRQKGFLVLTNKRIIEVTEAISWYCFPVGRSVKYVMPNSVREVGYRRRATFCCMCPAYRFYYEGNTQSTEILLKGANEMEATNVINAFYAAINQSALMVKAKD